MNNRPWMARVAQAVLKQVSQRALQGDMVELREWMAACGWTIDDRLAQMGFQIVSSLGADAISRIITEDWFAPGSPPPNESQWEAIGRLVRQQGALDSSLRKLSNTQLGALVAGALRQAALSQTGQPQAAQVRVGGGPHDRYVVALFGGLLVIDARGEVRVFGVDGERIFALDGTLPGAPVAATAIDRRVLAMDRRLLVINARGEVWAHPVGGGQIGAPVHMPGAPVATSPQDRHVVVFGSLLLVVNARGEVWAHATHDDRISDPARLPGAPVAAMPQDRRVLVKDHHLLVINAQGQVWAHAVNQLTVGQPVYVGQLPGLTADQCRYAVVVEDRLLAITASGEVRRVPLTV